MGQKGGIWHIIIPDFQVLAKTRNPGQPGFWAKMMTKQLHRKTIKKVTCDIRKKTGNT